MCPFARPVPDYDLMFERLKLDERFYFFAIISTSLGRYHCHRSLCHSEWIFYINLCKVLANRLQWSQLIFPDKGETNPRLWLWHFSHFYGPFTAFSLTAQYDDIEMIIS